jgi:hypothetical protein
VFSQQVDPNQSVNLSDLDDPQLIPAGGLGTEEGQPDPHRLREYVFAPFDTIGSLTASFTVPPLPRATPRPARLYLFPGIQADTQNILLQTVLQCSGDSWQISSVCINIGKWKFYSSPVGVNPGDLIQVQISSTSQGGKLDWMLFMGSASGNTQLMLVEVDSELFRGGMVIGGQLEAYDVEGSLQLPNDNHQTVFSQIVVTDREGNDITAGLEWSRVPALMSVQGAALGVSFTTSPTTVTVSY